MEPLTHPSEKMRPLSHLAGGLAGYAVASLLGVAVVMLVLAGGGRMDPLGSLQFFAGLGGLGAHLGARLTRPQQAGRWDNLLLLTIVVLGSVGLTFLAGWLHG